MKLTLTYGIFALIATATNIAAQDLTLRVYDGAYALGLSLIVGTGVGLLVKYVLDKRYIFQFHAKNAVHDGRIFVLYSTMGLATTLIFWGFELGFHVLFQTDAMRYLGGIIGLSIGYLAKYHLDKRYVFRTEAPT